MATAFERLPKEEQERLARYKEHLKLLRMALGMSQVEFARRCGLAIITLANAENDNGAFTTKTHHKVERVALETIKADQADWNNKPTLIAAYVLDILIRNPDCYSEEVIERCEYYANLFVPALHENILPISDINNEWITNFVDRYNAWIKTDYYKPNNSNWWSR